MYLKPFDVEINSLSKRCYGLPSPEIGDITGERGLEIGERNLEAFGRTGITIKTWEIVSTRNKVPKIEIDFITNYPNYVHNFYKTIQNQSKSKVANQCTF